MKYKYKENDILFFKKDNKKIKIQILENFHLIYKGKYPTYKVKFLENYYLNDNTFDDIKIKLKTEIVPECMLYIK